jgi:hypothetical protein
MSADELLREARESMLRLVTGKPVRDFDELLSRIDAHLASGGWIECSESGAKRNAAMIPYENLDMHLCTERNGKWYARQPLPSLPKDAK